MRVLGLCLGLSLTLAGCGSSDDGSGASGSSGSGGSAATGGSGGNGGSSGSSGAGGGGTSGAGGGGTGGSSGSTADPFAEARQICIDKINELRATKGLPPYQRWTSAETCVDQQATDDEKTGQPHNAWSTHKFACDGYGSAQNECLGGGAGGIVNCLEMMWAEKDQAGCSGCDQCTSSGGCADCDFYGSQTGDVCGHYLNMRATWFTMAACGFSADGGWAAINFQ